MAPQWGEGFKREGWLYPEAPPFSRLKDRVQMHPI